MEMCRACLKIENAMNPLDTEIVSNYNTLSSLSVSLDDGMPQYICENCDAVIKLFIEFRAKSVASETTLRELFENTKSEQARLQLTIEDCKADVSDTDVKDIINEEIKTEILCNDYNSELIDDFYNDDINDHEQLLCDVKDDLDSQNKKSATATPANYKLLSCGLCDHYFEEKDSLLSHLQSHENSTKCNNCDAQFENWQQLLGHRLVHLPSSQRRCHLCNRRHMSPLNLEFHYRIVHGEGKRVLLKCEFCAKEYETPRKLRKHIWSTHENCDKFICDYCSKSFSNKNSVKSHILSIHTEIKTYLCRICGTYYKTSSSLKDHIIRRHSKEKVSCTKCKRVFMNKQSYNKHNCKINLFICPVCGKECGSKYYNRHMEHHDPVGRYKCDRCSKTYKSKMALKAHVNRHDGNRTVKCEYCPATFYVMSSLIRHRRTHTGEKPYACTICSRRFMSNSNLKIHMKVHGIFIINHKNKGDNAEII